MKLKETVKILTDQNKFKEVKGLTVPYKDGIISLNLIIHMSENAWEPNTVEVSEQVTGCRLFSMKQELKDIKPSDIIKETTDFIKSKGKKAFLNKVQEKTEMVRSLGIDK